MGFAAFRCTNNLYAPGQRDTVPQVPQVAQEQVQWDTGIPTFSGGHVPCEL